MARREARASYGKFALAGLSIAVAAAGVYSLRALTGSLVRHISATAQERLGGDIAVYLRSPPSEGKLAALSALDAGLHWSLVLETDSAIVSESVPDPVRAT